MAADGVNARQEIISVSVPEPVVEAPAAPVADPEERIARAWARAHAALQLAVRAGMPLPSARMYPDGSGEFIFPGRLAQALKGNAAELTKLLGSNRLSVASTVAEDADAVSIRVPGDVLGREQD